MLEHDEVHVHEAAVTEVQLLLHARHEMLAELTGDLRLKDLETVDDETRAFVRENARLGPIGFIAEDSRGDLVGAVSIAHELTCPSMHNPSGRQAYLYGMWVRPASRRKGVARSLVATAVAASRAAGAGAVTLVASEGGKPLYRSLGFVEIPAMRLSFEPLLDIRGCSGEPD